MEVKMTLDEYERLSAEKARYLLQIAELERRVGCLQTENDVLKDRIRCLEKPTTTIEMHNHFEQGSSNQVFNGDALGKFGTM